MKSSQRYSVVRDPVHGDIYLTHDELRLVDTREFQRLRGVRQLGTACLVYPGALHTRFEHSIGTLHCTQRMIEAINLNFELDPRGLLGISAAEARVIRVAALLHDITHIPFGHNIEDQTGLIPRHDKPERYRGLLAPQTELGAELERQGLLSDVLAILAPGPTAPAVPPYWSQVLSDTICSDLIDYLARDAYFTGLKLQIDPRITSYFKIDRASGNLFIDLAKRKLLREDILSELVRMLEVRYYFSERVYYHHAKVSAGALVARAMELLLVGGQLSERDLFDQTDASLVELLERRAEGAQEPQRSRVRALLQRFRERRLLKRVCVFPRYANAAVQDELVERYFARGRHEARAAVEARIADLMRFASGRAPEVLVYCPAASMQLKEAQTHVRWPGVEQLLPLSAHAARVPRLADLERSYRELWKFYVFADVREPERIAQLQRIALAEFPGAVNVYDADEG